IASAEGRQLFGSSSRVGWARNGSWEAPREAGMGPVPANWTQYKGYYLYGDWVILSYSVGETDILEFPRAWSHGESHLFSRGFEIPGREEELEGLLLEMNPHWKIESVRKDQIILTTDEGRWLTARLESPAEGASLGVQDSLLTFRFPPSEDILRAELLVWESVHEEDADRVPENHQPLQRRISDWTWGGPARWGSVRAGPATSRETEFTYQSESIPIPFENPWNAWIRLSGIDFFDDGGRAAVTTWNGDVWIVEGLHGDLSDIRWQRYASGLFYPMGVEVVDDVIYVTERSQLTRLHDLNGDGEADYYESLNHEGVLWPMAHALGLETDSEGNFYFMKNGNRVPSGIPGHGALIRVSADGSRREIVSNGSRGVNTLGINDQDQIFTADQQGNWVPVERVDQMTEGGFYGFRTHGGEGMPVGEFVPPVLWMPYEVNNSSGMMVWAGDDRWGPLADHWILGSYGQSRLFLILTQSFPDNRLQGASLSLPIETESGVIRGDMNPSDGQLYVAGLRGWTTLGTSDGSLERIRYTGKPLYLPTAFRAEPGAIVLTFDQPLDASSIGPDDFRLSQWEYRYTSRYGSAEYSLAEPEREGRDPLPVDAVTISEDRHVVRLSIDGLESVMQLEIAWNLLFADGTFQEETLWATINWLTPDESLGRPEWQNRILARHHEDREAPVESVTSGEPPDSGGPDWFNRGATLFENNCSSCHASDGVAPGMAASKWAGSSVEASLRILLQGKQGERGIMTPFNWLSNEELADLLSYIRSNFHDLDPVGPERVENIREETSNRQALWRDEELERYREP
ncbi:MAG: cytochrome c, partial [Balneolaceae bacterium]